MAAERSGWHLLPAARAALAALAALATLATASSAPALAQPLTAVEPAPPLVQIAAEPAWKAWWLRAILQPSGTEVRGLPLPRLHRDWCAADAFSVERFPQGVFIGPGGTDLLGAERAGFTVEGAFDGGLRRLIATVGAYRRCDGELGHFLLVLDPTRRGLKLRYLLERPFDGSVLTVLRQVDEQTLRWSPCLACNEGVLVRWNPQTRYFEPRPLKSDDDSQD
jgi:hypothetical protein